MKEPFIAPILRQIRIKKILPVIIKTKNCRVLDIGCGWNAKFLLSIEPFIDKGFGIDFKAPNIQTEKIRTIQSTIADKLPFEDSSFNVVTMMAVLEHLENPFEIIQEIDRVTQIGGQLVLTVPSKISKPVSEFLAYKIHIINEQEIKDHKNYYNKKDLYDLFKHTHFKIIKHRYFQLGLNNFCVLKKEV